MKKLFLLLVVLTSLINAQELNCKVSVSVEGLPVVNRDNLVGFGQVIEDYMNKTKFLNENWQGDKIDCNLTIYFLGAGDEINYTAQLFVSSKRPIINSAMNSQVLSIFDNSWNFQYEKGQSLYAYPNQYDPITSILDFYALLIIGFDADSWDPLQGTPIFSRASQIVSLGASSKYTAGWQSSGNNYSRYGIIDDLLNEKFRGFREGIAAYYLGLDIFGKNPVQGQEKMMILMKSLENMLGKVNSNSVLLKTFFDAKHGEIVEKLKTYPDKNFVKVLKKIDPPHSMKYDEIMAQ